MRLLAYFGGFRTGGLIGHCLRLDEDVNFHETLQAVISVWGGVEREKRKVIADLKRGRKKKPKPTLRSKNRLLKEREGKQASTRITRQTRSQKGGINREQEKGEKNAVDHEELNKGCFLFFFVFVSFQLVPLVFFFFFFISSGSEFAEDNER
jgi:hypothetical protein